MHLGHLIHRDCVSDNSHNLTNDTSHVTIRQAVGRVKEMYGHVYDCMHIIMFINTLEKRYSPIFGNQVRTPYFYNHLSFSE